MTEKVEIYGGQLDGSVLNNAASEATLERILEAIEKQGSKGGKSEENKAAKTAEAIQKTHNEAIRRGAFYTDEFSKQLSKSTDEISELPEKIENRFNRITESISNKLGNFVSGFGMVLSAIPDIMAGTAELAFKTSTPKVEDFTRTIENAIPVIGGFIGAFGEAIQGDINTYRQLSTVGATFGTSLEGYRRAAMEAGLSVDDFKKIVENNSQAFALLRGNVSEGANAFTAISGSVQKKFQPVFSKLGMTMEEVSGYTASYIEQMTKSGQARGMSDAELARGAEEYNLELDKMARATGISRKALDEANKAAMLDARSKIIMSSMTKEAQVALNAETEAMKKIGAGDAAKGLMDLVAMQGTATTDSSKKLTLLAEGAGVDIARITRDMANKVPGAEKEMMDGMARISAHSENLMKDSNNRMIANADESKQNYLTTAGSLMGLTNQVDAVNKATEEQANLVEKNNSSVLGMDKSLLAMRDNLSVAMMPILEKFGNVLSGLTETFKPGNPLFDNITNFATSVGNSLSTFMTLVGDNPGAAWEQLKADLSGIVQLVRDYFMTEILPEIKIFGAQIWDSVLPVLKDLGTQLKDYLLSGIEAMFTGAAIGGAIGAAVGLFFGPIGAAVGGAIGTAVGGFLGSWFDDKEEQDKKKQQLMKTLPTANQLVAEEAKKMETPKAPVAGGEIPKAVSEKKEKTTTEATATKIETKDQTDALKSSFEELIKNQGIATTEATKNLVISNPELLKIAEQVKAGTLSTEQAIDKMKTTVNTNVPTIKPEQNIIKPTNIASPVAEVPVPGATKFDVAAAARVAEVKTSAEIAEIVNSLQALDYTRLTVPTDTIKSIETGTLKTKSLKDEVVNLTNSFKDLDNVGLSKITDGLKRLDESFKSFSTSFSTDFLAKFKELDKKSQEALLSDLNGKMDQLNSNIEQLVNIQAGAANVGKKTLTATQNNSGSIY